MSQDNRKSFWESKSLLILSLALNIFFVGTVVGGFVVGHRIHERTQAVRHAPPIHTFGSPRKLMRHLEPEDREVMSKLMRSEMEEMRPRLKEVGNLRHKAMETLKADPFDARAAEKAFADLAIAEAKIHEESSQTMVKMLEALPKEKRAEVVRRMHEHRRDRHRKGERKGERQFKTD